MVQQQSMREAERRAQPNSVRNGRTVPRVPVLLDFRGAWPPSRWSELPVGQPAQAGGTGRRPPAPPQSLRSAADGQPYKDNFRSWDTDPIMGIAGRRILPRGRTHRPRRSKPTGRPTPRRDGRDGLKPDRTARCLRGQLGLARRDHRTRDPSVVAECWDRPVLVAPGSRPFASNRSTS